MGILKFKLIKKNEGTNLNSNNNYDFTSSTSWFIHARKKIVGTTDFDENPEERKKFYCEALKILNAMSDPYP